MVLGVWLSCSCCSNGQTVWAGWERRWVSSRCRVDGEGRGRAGIVRQIRDGGCWEANWKQSASQTPPPRFPSPWGSRSLGGQGRSTRGGTYRRGEWTRRVPGCGRGHWAHWASLPGPVCIPWDVQRCTSARAQEAARRWTGQKVPVGHCTDTRRTARRLRAARYPYAAATRPCKRFPTSFDSNMVALWLVYRHPSPGPGGPGVSG